jgi:hypothetical protein
MRVSEFICESYSFSPQTGVLCLNYSFDGVRRFEENIAFTNLSRTLSASEKSALDRVFRLLLLACGVSYYKAFAPKRIVCNAYPLDKATADFFTEFYVRGLGEFAWRNGITLGGLEFVAESVTPEPALRLSLPRLTCIPVGGGKDSIVTIECLKRSNEPVVLFELGNARPIEATIKQSGLQAIRVTRNIDPSLFLLNEAGALNGHVPITGILSMIVLACAILYGFDAIAMSNEHSASAPNIEDINHQYSKSFEFEQSFSRFIDSFVVKDFQYFSLLRPLSEIFIARQFSKHDAYFPIFRSCNSAFRQSVERRGSSWCCDCPKCRFVFLALAPFVKRLSLVQIFGRDLLHDPTQIAGFAELCGLQGHKPFECVGEIEESAAVMKHISGMPEWCDASVVRELAPRLVTSDFEQLFILREPHAVPARYLDMLYAC